ncbi:MAG: sensor histidine kinase KdpD, partial [Bdellovibrionia bacterium]
PDALLKAYNAEELAKETGRLRVFFGMSAGVGKTYAMLQAARQKISEGCDVVVGVVETHGRRETMALVEGLPIIPRKKTEYKGTLLEEMDLDAILERDPEIVLVDELAHTNVPGSRHPKRYQDVNELLDAGIDVFTTINVQHLASRKESVEQITQIQIRETVPDSILERAAQVELVDIAPVDLLKRLKEGKVYLGDKAELAANNFFKEDRLTALREIALRMTAEKVDHELQRFTELKQGSSPWQTNERLMVAVSHSPFSERLVRATRRYAYNLEAPWVAVYVDTGKQLKDADQAQLTKNLNLARELGAEVMTTTDTDIAAALKRLARQKNVTQILVGRPTRRLIKDMIEGGTLLDRLVRENGEIDVHVIRHEGVPTYKVPFFEHFQFSSGFIQYWNTFWFLFGTAFVSGLLDPLIGYRAVGFIFLLAVLVVGLRGSRGQVFFAALISALSWNFFFIPPRFTFYIRDPEDIIMCVAYFVVALITGFLTSRIRLHELLMRDREEHTNILYEILQTITASREKKEFLTKIMRRLSEMLDADCGVVLRGKDGKADFTHKPYTPTLDEKEKAVAMWAFSNHKVAGWSTDTLPEAQGLYIPLQGASEFVGILIFKPKKKRKLHPEQENLLYSVAKQLAISLERHFLEKRLRESDRLEESEKLHQTLLNSISHEMRTPLTSMMGAATALEQPETAGNPQIVMALASQLRESSDRMNRVIENLLDMSRLNSGVLSLNLEWHDVRDLVGVTIQKLGKNVSQHKILMDIPDGLPMLKIDFRFMEHALSNLVLNAVTYSPAGTVVRISAKTEDGKLNLYIEDEGPGIPKEHLSEVFAKFFRVPGTPAGGTGLGLSIVRSIVEAHQGAVRSENRETRGARFVIELPIQEGPKPPGEKDT